jgi:hypothetical protein
MEKISFKEGIIRLKQDFKLEGIAIDEDFQWRDIINSDEEILSDLVFSNCSFGGKFGIYSVTYRGSLNIHNCVFQSDFIFFNIFMYKNAQIKACHMKGISDMSSGAFYNDIELSNNIFDGFVSFDDADIRGQATFINNQFKGGTNLMHPKGGPSGAHFALTPHLEGNEGLDRYEV